MTRWRWLLLSLTCWALPARADFSDGFNHPEVDWLEFETEHFTLVYCDGLESTARLSAEILESRHPGLCRLFGVEPQTKTTVVLADFDDVGFNNFTRRMQHVIYISNPVMNQARVDRRTWLEHLLPHEYAHVLNGWAYRDWGRTVGEWIEWTGMELQPQWFTEGLAEFAASEGRLETPPYVLDAARQGELLDGAKLDLRDARFNVIETAMVYKQGHAMVIELVRRHGPEVLAGILEQYAHTPQFDLAFRLETGRTVEAFVADCLRTFREEAGAVAQVLACELLDVPLEAALAARRSPDGRRLAVLGIEDWEDPIPALFVEGGGGGRRKIATNLDLYDSWKLSWSPDSRLLVYTGRIRAAGGSVRNALFCHDASRDRTWRIDTGDRRVLEPEFSPDGSRLAFVTYEDERAKLAILDLATKAVSIVTEAVPYGCFAPTWSPDGRRLAFSLATPDGLDIAVIGVDGTGLRKLTDDPEPDQYPAWSPDGSQIAFVSYRFGAQPGAAAYAAVSAEAEGLAGAGTGIYGVPAGGGEVRPLAPLAEGGLYYPMWEGDGRALLASLLRIRRADIVRIPVTPLTPEVTPTTTAAQLQGPTPATIGSSPRRYDGLRRLRPFVLRPITGDDGLGDTWGARQTWGDPLLRHNIVAEGQLGVGSHQVSYEFQYLDDSLPVRLGVNAFRRVPPPRGERGALVAETTQGFELLADWPVVLTDNPYVRDRLIFGFEMADHQPFGSAGGGLRPPPRGAWIIGPSLGWQRVQLIPGHGDQEMRVQIARSDNAVGADLDFATADLLFARRQFLPDPRGTLTAGAALNWFDGQDFTRAEVQRWLLSGQLRYDLRLADELFSRYTWPYLHVGPVHLSASYELRELINGSAGGANLADQVTLELTNEGHLSRHVVYLLRVGQRFEIGGREESEAYLGIEFNFRELPY